MHEGFAVEEVNAHRGLVAFGRRVEAQFGKKRTGNTQAIEHGRVGRFFHEPRDTSLRIGLHDAESLGRLPVDRQGGDGQIGAGCEVVRHEDFEIHLVKLVAAKDEEIIPRALEEVGQILADGIGGALVPAGTGRRLLGGENFHEAARAEDVEFVGRADVLVKRYAVELREQVDAADAGVEAIADRDVDEAVFAAQRDGWLRAVLGQREEPLARAATHDDAEGAGKGFTGLGGIFCGHDSQRESRKPAAMSRW